MNHSIREAVSSDVPALTEIIRNSFRDVAVRFGLTEANCPKHPSNCREQWIVSALEKGVRCFVLESDGVPCGCVALERPRPEVCYLERLAVLPEYRRMGLGRALAEYAVTKAGEAGAVRVEIGVIAGQEELKEWYRRLGFVETGRASFPHLPFEVAFMAKVLDSEP